MAERDYGGALNTLMLSQNAAGYNPSSDTPDLNGLDCAGLDKHEVQQELVMWDFLMNLSWLSRFNIPTFSAHVQHMWPS